MSSKIRSISGSILMLFVAGHLINHIFGLQSLEAMEAAHGVLMEIWRTPAGSLILGVAFFSHYGVALITTYKRRTLALTGWEWTQLATGLIIPLLIAEHILGTRVVEEVARVKPDYAAVIGVLWVFQPTSGIIQALAVIVVWTHGAIGLHFWLKTKSWYYDWYRPLRFTAIVLPVLSLSGFVAAGFAIAEDPNLRSYMERAVSSADTQALLEIQGTLNTVLLILLAAGISPFAARAVRSAVTRKPKVVLMLPDGTKVPNPEGATALEALRAAGKPHAAVCGGRGRCTTCRVRVLQGADLLEQPEQLEQAALTRIKALDGVRLACQIRPKSNLGVSPLLPPTASARDGRKPGGLEGEERQVSCLFIDIRGSTRLGEEKLPFDVLFILNQFFSEMSQAIEETGGHYAQFNGDGLMALYGLHSEPAEGAKAAINGAQAMLDRVEKLNQSLDTELPFPMRVGIGLHMGEAIVGAMGPPKAQITSAIGDNINITARLESLTKEYEAPLIISEELAQAAGIDATALTRAEVQVRGREAPVAFYAVKDAAAL